MGKRFLILANGEWGADAGRRLQLLLATSDVVIATDGALDRACEHGIAVHTHIGDMDSISNPEDLESRYPGMEILRYPAEKDWTDLELAIDWALESDPASIRIYGATGGRIDHTMANLSLLEKGLHSGVRMQLIAGRETVQLIQGDLSLDEAQIGDRVSLLPVSLFSTVTTQGLQYTLHGEKLFRGKARGLSNVVTATPVRIGLESGILAVIHAQDSEQRTEPS